MAVATTSASLSPARWLELGAALVAGTLPFAAFGVAIGYWVPARGALPIMVGEDVIGAAGVSGAPGGDKDEACVKAALDKVADQLK